MLDMGLMDFQKLDQWSDRTIYQTLPWLKFVSHTQKATPVMIEITHGERKIGFFTGLIIRKYGLKILGSPLPGWTTSFMGFNLVPGFSRKEIIGSFKDFVFETLGCHHFELMDRYLTLADAGHLKMDYRVLEGFEIDLRPDEDVLFSNMKDSCRRCIRKAEKSGLTIEEAGGDAFVEEYYSQLIDVFAKQSLVPTYNRTRVAALIKYIFPTGNLLLLRARDDKGRSIATGIFPAFNRHMYFWGGASLRTHQHFRPNEAIIWYAMNYWKKRGIELFDMGGGGEYKRKYGGNEIGIPWLHVSKYKIFSNLRNSLETLTRFRSKVLGGVSKLSATRLFLVLMQQLSVFHDAALSI